MSSTPFASSEYPSSSATRVFVALCLIHLIAWTLMPVLLHGNLPFDTVEGIAWGRQWQWGYDKHPPLAAWLSALVSHWDATRDIGVYALGQLSVVACFYGVWKLGLRLNFSPARALLAVGCLEGIYYYTMASNQFNPNVLMLPLWSACAYWGHRAFTDKHYRSFVLLGVCAGLSLMAKYESVLLLMALFGASCLPDARMIWKTPKPYLALIIGLGVFSPHLYWMIQSHFISLVYLGERLDSFVPPQYFPGFSHLYFPGRFLFEQLCAALPAILLLLPVVNLKAERPNVRRFDLHFVALIQCVPLILILILSAVSGKWMHALWGFPIFCWIGVFVLQRYALNPAQYVPTLRRTALVMIVMLLGRACFLEWGPLWVHRNFSIHYPGKDIGQALSQVWEERAHQPLAYVAGDLEEVENVSVYAPSRPIPFFYGSLEHSAWIKPEDVKRQGMLVVWKIIKPEQQHLSPNYTQSYPGIKQLPSMTFAFHSPLKETITLGLAWLPPQKIKR